MFTKKLKLALFPTDINRLLAGLRHQIFVPGNIRWTTHFARDLAMIRLDPDKLKEVFLHCMKNAIDAMPDGGELLITTARDAAGSVKISFKDSGVGIRKEDQPQIFEPMYSTKLGGSGLSLAISRQIVKEHEGTIEFESVPKKGTTFTITLPYIREAAPAKSKKA